MATLLEIHRHHEGTHPGGAELQLNYDARQKSRFRATLSNGREVGVFLPRGRGLRDGDLLEVNDGSVVVVRALPEPVSRVQSHDLLLLGRAAYHLGNRHMAVQILAGELRYYHDHVIDDMMRQLGLEPVFAELPFEPESGAYGSGHGFTSHPHYHSHGSAHGHESQNHQAQHEREPQHDHHAQHGHQAQHDHSAHGSVLLRRSSPHRAGVIHVNWEEVPPPEADQ